MFVPIEFIEHATDWIDSLGKSSSVLHVISKWKSGHQLNSMMQIPQHLYHSFQPHIGNKSLLGTKTPGSMGWGQESWNFIKSGQQLNFMMQIPAHFHHSSLKKRFCNEGNWFSLERRDGPVNREVQASSRLDCRFPFLCESRLSICRKKARRSIIKRRSRGDVISKKRRCDFPKSILLRNSFLFSSLSCHLPILFHPICIFHYEGKSTTVLKGNRDP